MQCLASLRAFDALCQYESLTAAAEALNQPKSTVSRRLSQLEEDVGQSLVARNGNKLTLTQAGELFAIYCKQVLDVAQKSQEAMQALNNEISGQITVVVHPNLLRSWFAKILDQFLNTHPGVRVKLIAQHIPPIDSSVDLLIWVGESPENNFRREAMGYWKYGLYASPDYLKRYGELSHPRELVSHRWVDLIATRREGLTLYHPKEGSFTLPAADSRLESDSIVMQADAIRNGQGIGILPQWFATRFEMSHPGSASPCLPEWQTQATEIACYYTTGRPALRVRTLLDMLRANCPEEWKFAHSTPTQLAANQ